MIMKKIYISLIALFVLTTACNKDFLDEKPFSSFSPEINFETIEGAKLALNGTYWGLLDTWNLDYVMTGESGTDVSCSPWDGMPMQIPNYKATPAHDFLKRIWQRTYNGIYRCNVVIDRTSAMTAGEESERQAIIAEAKTVRAIYYFDLVNFWDNPPLVINEFAEEVAPTNSNPQEIFTQIIEDLQYAEQYGISPDGNLGRANKGVAKTLLAKVYLYVASEYWRDKVTISGNAYQLAADKADEVINSDWYSLQTTNSARPDEDYAKNFLQTKQGGCPEVIMPINFSTAVWKPTKFGQWGAPRAVPSGFDPRNNKYFYHREGGWIQPTGMFSMSFHEGDVRFQWSIAPTLYKPTTTIPQDLPAWMPGKWRAEESIGWGSGMAPTYLRLADVYLIKAEALNGANNGPTAEAYTALNAVRNRAHIPEIDEAYLNASNPHPSPDVLWGMQTDKYLEDSNDPNYPGRHVYYTNGFIEYPTLKDKFDAAVLTERAWELCFERQRWMDCKRTKRLEKIMKADRFKWVQRLKLTNDHTMDDPFTNAGENFITYPIVSAVNGGLGNYIFMVPNFNADRYRFPIPQSEMDANENLDQNSGY
jgi:starch-binding outer membrane protein, SusD/RagB family